MTPNQPQASDASSPNPLDNSGTLIQCSISDSFAAWMSKLGGTLLVTTYQAGKLAMIGWDGRQVTLLMRQFPKPMGLAVHGNQLALATRNEITWFANSRLLAHEFVEDKPGRYDALYLPRATYHTGDINAHDLAFGTDGLWVVNTRFGCLSALSHDHSFIPKWKPPFITQIAPEDRCHLNGLAVIDGRPRYVTCLGETDSAGAWRENKATGGLIVDVDANQIVLRGMSMPHSPRFYKGQLWVLNSGTGELWVVEPNTGKHVVVCALPGYLRGLAFAGQFAIVGMCMIREKHIFGGLPVQQKHEKLLCGIAVIDLLTGRVVGQMEFTAGCQELYEIAFLPGVRQGMILNLEADQVRQAFTAPEFAYWLRPSAMIKDPPPASPQRP